MYCSNAFAAEVSRHQIENRIRDLLTSNTYFLEVTSQTPVSLTDHVSPSIEKALKEIRLSISILFAFLRRPNLDSVLVADIKDWTCRLTTLLLRFATWTDHLFILHHVLRCPVEIGSWAARLVQVPSLNFFALNSPFTSPLFHHILTLLVALLSPTKRRSEFLAKHKDSVDPVSEDLWVLVDSDGEDGSGSDGTGLRENDIVAIINQIPLQSLFACITCAGRKNDGFYISSDAISGHHVLQSIAFCTNLIELFGQGLRTYEGEKYRQFSKRLARMIKHVVQYISEMQEILTGSSKAKDAEIRLRIHLEHNMLVLKACYWIYRSQRVGAWQYLVGVPFELLSKEALYKLYYAFNKNFPPHVIDDMQTNYADLVKEPLQLFSSFVECETGAEDIFHMLQVFASMATSRSDTDWDFITTIAEGLYMVRIVCLSVCLSFLELKLSKNL